MRELPREKIVEIIERDLPGWSLPEDYYLKQMVKGNKYMVLVQKGSVRKAITISDGKVVGAEYL